MVVVDIEIIHGDHLVQSPAALKPNDLAKFTNQLTALANENPDATAITLSPLNGSGVVNIKTANSTRLVTLENTKALGNMDEASIQGLAHTYYAGTGEIVSLTLIENNPPSEIGARPLPLWRVDFDDAWGSTLYISPVTGALATRRHTLWRVFDFLWMLHIMDYDEREDINNAMLRSVSILAFLLVLSGVWYLYFRLNMKSLFRSSTK